MTAALAITGSIPEATQFVELCRRLEQQGIQLHLATYCPGVNAHLEKSGWEKRVFLDAYRLPNRPPVDVEALMCRFESPTVAELISAEQVFKSWDRDKKLRLLAACVDLYEAYFSRYRIQVVILSPTTSILYRSAFIAAKSMGIRTLVVSAGPVVTDSSVFNDVDEGWMWAEFLDAYNQSEPVSDDMRQTVNEFVGRIFSIKKSSMNLRGGNFVRFLARVARTTIQDIKLGRRRPSVWNDLYRDLQREAGRLLLPLIKYQQPSDDDKYIFFPLHMSFDAQIAARNPMFASQEALIEMISLATPPGYQVFVKEHPYSCGGINFGLHRWCRHFDNVSVLHPSNSSLVLIEKAAAVISINSTAGWETILKRVPLIVLGRPYYGEFRLAHKIENINDLPATINSALVEGRERYLKNEDEWVRFIHSVVTTAKPASMLMYKEYMGLDRNMSNERLDNLAAVLRDAISVPSN